MGGEHRLGRPRAEDLMSGQHLIGHRTDGVEIGAMVRRGIGSCLFWRHIGWSPKRHAE